MQQLAERDPLGIPRLIECQQRAKSSLLEPSVGLSKQAKIDRFETLAGDINDLYTIIKGDLIEQKCRVLDALGRIVAALGEQVGRLFGVVCCNILREVNHSHQRDSCAKGRI